MAYFIEVRNVVKNFKVGETNIHALAGMTFCANEGELVVVLGPSGSGKTTLLNLLGGMDTISQGEIIVGGKRLKGLSQKELTQYRRYSVGFVFQFYNLMPNLTALENVELATEICSGAMAADEALKRVGLEDRQKNFPAQLSGGEQQRVSIARAIAKNPQIMLCDEPTGALDYQTGKRILTMLQDICRKEKKTVIIVTHNSALKYMADRVVFVKNGVCERMVINPAPKSIEEIEW